MPPISDRPILLKLHKGKLLAETNRQGKKRPADWSPPSPTARKLQRLVFHRPSACGGTPEAEDDLDDRIRCCVDSKDTEAAWLRKSVDSKWKVMSKGTIIDTPADEGLFKDAARGRLDAPPRTPGKSSSSTSKTSSCPAGVWPRKRRMRL